MDRLDRAETPRGQQAAGNWRMLKGKLREKWGDLTDDELDRLEGRKEQLVGYLQEKEGRQRAEIEKEIDSLSRDINYAW